MFRNYFRIMVVLALKEDAGGFIRHTNKQILRKLYDLIIFYSLFKLFLCVKILPKKSNNFNHFFSRCLH